MALSKKHFVFAFVAVYGILMMLILIEFKFDTEATFCDHRMSCVPFCCKNATLCKETTIRNTINQTAIKKFYGTEMTILYGKPTCSSLGPVEKPKTWGFALVS
jgi:hypothetical protein